ncbi:MAG: M23 family metallopeptidase [Candidatus Krumholzibacteriota bacterium]|nr:M23 family metallopeptidase [Candidatus Krumholzibacteriota bacterium]
MEKETFSVIIVPHDLKKTRTYKIPYRLFYFFMVILAAGALTVSIFVLTYGRLLVKTRETVRLERQVAELTKKNEKIGELMRDLSEMHAMELKVRNLLGLGLSSRDSVALKHASAGDLDMAGETDNEKSSMMSAIPSFWPVRGYITKGYNIAGGEKDKDYHPGIDIGVEKGVPVRAAAAGYVIEAAWDDTYGYFVKIDHGYGIKTLYGHNERLVVIKGDRIGRGQTIAYSGNTGRSSAPHLHFEVTQNNLHVDPLKYLLQ